MDIKTLNSYLENSWSKETCYEKNKKEWKKENPSFGQCYITSLILNDFFGGKIIKTKLSNGITHYWNLIDNKEIDLTRKQFQLKENFKIDKIYSKLNNLSLKSFIFKIPLEFS